MNGQTINKIIGINESFKLPDRLMEILLNDEERDKTMTAFMEVGESLDHDWFTQYFEEEHANKSKMAQDFTPSAVADILAEVVGGGRTVADICSGTGGLTIAYWNRWKDVTDAFYCFEYSERAIPLLLFNLSIRNIAAFVTRVDLLTGEEFEKWIIRPSERFGTVMPCDFDFRELQKADVAISNPPYSQKYDPKKDRRFQPNAELLPPNFADFVFMEYAMTITNGSGRIGFILPHGVLFRGNKEQAYRKMLIENFYIENVIGLPDKLFINTQIPTLIIQLDKRSADTGTYIIDASKLCTKGPKMNVMEKEHIEKICNLVKLHEPVEKLADIATLEAMRENDYNLNIPRYVDTSEEEELPALSDVLDNIIRLEQEIRTTETGILNTMIDELIGFDKEEQEKLQRLRRIIIHDEPI